VDLRALTQNARAVSGGERHSENAYLHVRVRGDCPRRGHCGSRYPAIVDAGPGLYNIVTVRSFRFGFQFTNDDPGEVVRSARAAEDVGFHIFHTGDHVNAKPFHGEFKRSMQRQQDCSSLLLSASDGSVAASC